MFKTIFFILCAFLHIVVALPAEMGAAEESGVVTRGVFATHGKAKTECLDHARLPSLKVGRKCFYVVDSFSTEWHNALRFCHANGLKLAKIASAQEHKAVLFYLNSSGPPKVNYWLSGTDLGTEGTYYWFEDDTPMLFAPWGQGQPDNSVLHNKEGENCLELWNYDALTFNDRPCNFKNFFICESS